MREVEGLEPGLGVGEALPTGLAVSVRVEEGRATEAAHTPGAGCTHSRGMLGSS